MKELKKGIMFKERFCEVWGGLYLTQTVRFFHGTLDGLSRCITTNAEDAGVVVEYDDGKDT